MSKETKRVSTSNRVLALLGVGFIVLKLTGHIDWSWWWVLAPFWIPVALVLPAVVVVVAVAAAVNRK